MANHLKVFSHRVGTSFRCRFDEFWTFKVDILLATLNTILEVVMWYFLAQIIDPDSLGYAEVGYLPFILVGSVAIYFVDSVYSNFTQTFRSDRDSGIFKLAYLSNMGMVQYFLINFIVSTIFDIFTVFIPMFITFFLLVQFTPAATAFYLGVENIITMAIALAIFLVGNLGFQLMTVGSELFLKQGDPVGFFMEQFNKLFSGQLFPLTYLPRFLAFLPKILPSAYIILLWRETLFKNVVFYEAAALKLVIAGFAVNLLVFVIGLSVFYHGVNRAKLEGRWF